MWLAGTPNTLVNSTLATKQITRMLIAITGSNGFIGSELVKYLLSLGHEVLLLQRKKPERLENGAYYQRYDLSWPEKVLDLKGVDALVHTAFVPFNTTNSASYINIPSTLRLYNQCINSGIQFIFLSSMSAHENALSEYGKHKYKLEQRLDSSKCLILKLGLVIGNDGLFKRIYDSFKKMPFAVLVAGGKQPIQPVYIGDVVKVIAGSIAEKRTGKFTLACNQVYTLRELSLAIADKAGKNPLFIPVPYWIVSLIIGVITFLHLPFPVSKENLLGLKQLRAADTGADLEKLGIVPLGLKESIERL